MSRRTIIALAASVIFSIGCIVADSTDAFARGGRAVAGAGRVGVARVGVAPVRRGVRAGVAVGVGAAAVRGAYCGYAPYPPCY
jgi:hypothetical protein